MNTKTHTLKAKWVVRGPTNAIRPGSEPRDSRLAFAYAKARMKSNTNMIAINSIIYDSLNPGSPYLLTEGR